MFLLTWPIDLIVAGKSIGITNLTLPLPVVLLVGVGFVIAAVVMSFITEGKSGAVKLLRRFLIWRVSWVWYLSIFIIPLIYYIAALINAALNHTTIDLSNALIYQLTGLSMNLWVLAVIWFVFTALTNLEEIGWRGFVLPRLQNRYSIFISALIVAVIWWFWHLPKFLVGGFNPMFFWWFFDVLAKSIMLALLYNNTKGSLLLVTLFHAAINTAGVILPIASTVSNEGSTTFFICLGIELLVAFAIASIFASRLVSRNILSQTQT